MSVLFGAFIESFPEEKRPRVRVILTIFVIAALGAAGYGLYTWGRNNNAERQQRQAAQNAELMAHMARSAPKPPPRPAKTPEPEPATPTPEPTPEPDPAVLAAADALIADAGKKWEAEDYKTALLLAQKALAIRQRELGDDHPKVQEVQRMIEAANQKLAAPN